MSEGWCACALHIVLDCAATALHFTYLMHLASHIQAVSRAKMLDSHLPLTNVQKIGQRVSVAGHARAE